MNHWLNKVQDLCQLDLRNSTACSFGWLLVAGADCSERKVLPTGCWWLVCSERKVLVAGG
jgi:hypothetical protein